jgi:hypothetical protein
MAILTILEFGHGDKNFVEILEDAAMEHLFLERPIEPFGNTIGLRFGDEGKAWRDTPELDLVEEVVSGMLRAVVHAQGQSASRVGAGGAKHRLEALRNRLQGCKAITGLHGMNADATGIEMVHRQEDPYPAIVHRLDSNEQVVLQRSGVGCVQIFLPI